MLLLSEGQLLSEMPINFSSSGCSPGIFGFPAISRKTKSSLLCTPIPFAHAQSDRRPCWTTSNSRRQALARLDTKVERGAFPPSIILKHIKEGLGWASDEGINIVVCYARLLLSEVTFSMTKNDFVTAKQWVNKAYRKVEGEGSCNVKRMEEIQAAL
jgi:hypothetical protein